MINSNDRNITRTIILPLVVVALSLATAFIGAVILGNDRGIDEVNLFVERLSGDSGSWLGGLVGASYMFALAA